MSFTKLNMFQALGRLVKDPEFKEVKGNKNLMTFSFAYNTIRKTDKEGSNSNFIDVEVWDKLATTYYGKLKKGMQIIITGELALRRYKGLDNKWKTRANVSASSILISDLYKRPQFSAAETEEYAKVA